MGSLSDFHRKYHIKYFYLFIPSFPSYNKKREVLSLSHWKWRLEFPFIYYKERKNCLIFPSFLSNNWKYLTHWIHSGIMWPTNVKIFLYFYFLFLYVKIVNFWNFWKYFFTFSFHWKSLTVLSIEDNRDFKEIFIQVNQQIVNKSNKYESNKDKT